MNAKNLPVVFVGLALIAIAYAAGAFEIPTVPLNDGRMVMSSVDEPRSERSAILTDQVRLHPGAAKLILRDDRWLNPGWELVALFYPVSFALMAYCYAPRCLSNSAIEWGYFVGVLVSGPILWRLIRADFGRQSREMAG
jgi:hypothetical protein